MVISWDTGSDGAPPCLMAAWSRTRKQMPVRVMRAVRRPASRGVMAIAAVSSVAVLAGQRREQRPPQQQRSRTPGGRITE